MFVVCQMFWGRPMPTYNYSQVTSGCSLTFNRSLTADLLLSKTLKPATSIRSQCAFCAMSPKKSVHKLPLLWPRKVSTKHEKKNKKQKKKTAQILSPNQYVNTQDKPSVMSTLAGTYSLSEVVNPQIYTSFLDPCVHDHV